MVVVTYDEFGGQWDHVSPPGQGGSAAARTTSGARARASRRSSLVAGPARRRSPSTTPQYDTTSILEDDRAALAPAAAQHAGRGGERPRARLQGEGRRQVRHGSSARQPRGTRTLRCAPCGSCSSRRCIPGRTRRTSGRSSRRSSARSSTRGHEVDRAVLDSRAGGKLRYLELARRTLRARAAGRRVRALPRAERPDRGARRHARRSSSPRTAATCATSAELPGVAAATRARRAARGHGRLRVRVSAPRARGEAAGGARQDGGRLERRRPRAVRRRACAGRAAALSLRRRARRAQERRAARGRVRAARREATLTFVGDGPLRGALEGRAGVRLLGRVPHDEVPGLLADAHVLCQPSLIEPLGQALLEGDGVRPARSSRRGSAGRRSSSRPTRASSSIRSTSTRSRAALARGGRAAAAERGGARGRRRARRPHAGGADRGDPQPRCGRSASLTSTSGRIVSSSPASRATSSACSQLSRAFCRVDALLQPVVARDEQLLDPLARVSSPFTSRP